MISIALIGGTGTGKSTISRYLTENYNARWLDCDAIGHCLLDTTELKGKLVHAFGLEIVDENMENPVNRKKLGAIVFNDNNKLNQLNAMIHPLIMDELKIRQEQARIDGKDLCILDGALLMDVNVRQMVDQVWAITADRDLRIQRLISGRGLSKEKAEQIMKNQISEKEYSNYADVTISTDLGVEQFSKQIDALLEDLYRNEG